MPRSFRYEMMRWISTTVIGSIPANGSSRHRKDGSSTSARVISTRRRSPPDSTPALTLRQLRDVRARRAAIAGAPWRSSSVSGSVSSTASRFCSTVSLRKTRRLLRQVADSAARALIERQHRDVLAAQRDAPRVGLEQSHQHVEGGRLARAVGTEQTRRLRPPLMTHVDVVHDRAPAVTLGELMPLQRAARAMRGLRLHQFNALSFYRLSH